MASWGATCWHACPGPFPYDIAAMTIGAMFGWFVFTRIAIPYLRPFYSNFVESEL